VTRADLHVGLVVSGRDPLGKWRRVVVVQLGRRRARVAVMNDDGTTRGDPWWVQPHALTPRIA
jgi:hypothetical protein